MKRHKNTQSDYTRAQLVLSVVALEFGTAPIPLYSEGKGAHTVALARQVGMYLVHMVYKANYVSIGQIFNRHASTVRHAVHQVEEYREDPVLDQKLRRLEKFLTSTPELLEAA